MWHWSLALQTTGWPPTVTHSPRYPKSTSRRHSPPARLTAVRLLAVGRGRVVVFDRDAPRAGRAVVQGRVRTRRQVGEAVDRDLERHLIGPADGKRGDRVEDLAAAIERECGPRAVVGNLGRDVGGVP